MQAHWLMRSVQRLGQFVAATILLAIVGYPLLHRHFVGTVSLRLGYLAVGLGVAVGFLFLACRGTWRGVFAALEGFSAKRFCLLLVAGAFVLHFAAFAVVLSLPGAGPPKSYDWVFFEASAMYPPGHSLVMEGLWGLFGNSRWVDCAFESALLMLACWSTYRLGAMAFGEGAGRLAGVVMAVLPSWLLYANLEYDLLLGTMLVLALYMYFAKPPSEHRYPYLALWGLLLGVTCLVKPIGLLVPGVAFFLYLGHRAGVSVAAKRTVVIVLFMLAGIAPWTIRNYVVMDRFVLLSTNLGVVLRTANNDLTDGREFPLEPSADDEDEVAMNQRLIREAVRWIATHPVRFARLMAYRTGWVWGSDSSFVSSNLYDKGPSWLVDGCRGLLQVSYIAMVLIWAIGLFVYRNELTGSMIGLALLLPPVYIWGVHLVCQAHGQHHLPVLPFMVITACGTLSLRRRRASRNAAGGPVGRQAANTERRSS